MDARGIATVCGLLCGAPPVAGHALAAWDQTAEVAATRTANPDGTVAVPARAGTGADRPDWHWRLSGTLIGPDFRGAVFAHVGESRSVLAGEQIDGWTLTAVYPQSVVLSAGNRLLSVTLEGFSPAEEAEAAQRRTEWNERVDAAVRARLAQQENQRQVAEMALLAATKRMVGR